MPSWKKQSLQSLNSFLTTEKDVLWAAAAIRCMQTLDREHLWHLQQASSASAPVLTLPCINIVCRWAEPGITSFLSDCSQGPSPSLSPRRSIHLKCKQELKNLFSRKQKDFFGENPTFCFHFLTKIFWKSSNSRRSLVNLMRSTVADEACSKLSAGFGHNQGPDQGSSRRWFHKLLLQPGTQADGFVDEVFLFVWQIISFVCSLSQTLLEMKLARLKRHVTFEAWDMSRRRAESTACCHRDADIMSTGAGGMKWHYYAHLSHDCGNLPGNITGNVIDSKKGCSIWQDFSLTLSAPGHPPNPQPPTLPLPHPHLILPGPLFLGYFAFHMASLTYRNEQPSRDCQNKVFALRPSWFSFFFLLCTFVDAQKEIAILPGSY